MSSNSNVKSPKAEALNLLLFLSNLDECLLNTTVGTAVYFRESLTNHWNKCDSQKDSTQVLGVITSFFFIKRVNKLHNILFPQFFMDRQY